MNDDRLSKLVSQIKRNTPATQEEIDAFERLSNITLGSEYKQFLLTANGGEGFVGQNYVILWRVGDLLTFNREYEVQENAPGLLLFGSSGGGEAYAFDVREGSMNVVAVPFVGMALEDAMPVADTFTGFLDALFRGWPG